MKKYLKFAKSRSGRIGLERHEIEEDKELLRIDKESLKKDKDEKYQAKKLYNLFLKVHKRATKIGLVDIANKRVKYLNFIIKWLNTLIKEEVSTAKEKTIMEQINTAINLYLNNFPTQDKKLSKWIKQIREIQTKLYGDIVEEDNLLREKENILRQEYQETKIEESA